MHSRPALLHALSTRACPWQHSPVGRGKHALNVSEQERQHIRELYVQGVSVPDIIKRVGRSESVVDRAVRGLKRPRLRRPRNAERDARMVELHKQGWTFQMIGDEFAISATRAWDVVSVLTGRRQRRPRGRNETPRLPPTKHSKPRLTRAQLTRRNAEMERLWLDGVSYTKLARRFQLAHERVRTIVRKRLRRRGKAPGNAWQGPRTVRLQRTRGD